MLGSALSRLRSRRGSVALGAAVTVLVTLITYGLPAVVPFDEVQKYLFQTTGRWFFDLEGPVYALRFTGGLVGGLCTGLLTRDRPSTGAVRGVAAALLAIVVIYLAQILFRTAYWVALGGEGTPPFVTLIVVPVIFVLPLVGTHSIGGFVGGWFGTWWANN